MVQLVGAERAGPAATLPFSDRTHGQAIMDHGSGQVARRRSPTQCLASWRVAAGVEACEIESAATAACDKRAQGGRPQFVWCAAQLGARVEKRNSSHAAARIDTPC